MDPDCIFCKICTGQVPCHKLIETDKVLAYLDINPLSQGHSLIVPKVHGAKLQDVSDDYLVELLPIVRKLAIAMGLDSYNVLQNNGKQAMQEVPHLHVHLIPKPSADVGLRGVSWNPIPQDAASIAALAAVIRSKLAE